MLRKVISLLLLFTFVAPVMQPAPAYAHAERCCTYSYQRTAQPLTLRVSPASPRQGDVIIARVNFPDAVQVVGVFGTRLLRFHPEEALTGTLSISRSFVGLIGLDAFLPAGVYSLTVTATNAQGEYNQSTQAIRVSRRSSVLESIKLSKTLSPTLDPAGNLEEASEFVKIYSGYTEQKMWSGPFRWPVKNKLSALYGNHRIYNGVDLGTYHGGYDIVAGTGTPVKVAASGRVVAVKRFLVHGLTVVLDHGYGVYTAYSHLSKTNVAVGDLITSTTQVIAQVGTTGRSQGPHLHFEIAVGGVPVDPGPWLQSTALP
jgi:murein DD-endopeptidase MepM/ murein hydrolase activator NlpD